MARPNEGLGDAFSCRIPLKLDKIARASRRQYGTPLSVTVRTWLDDYFRLKDGDAAELPETDAHWKTRYYRVKKKLERLKAAVAQHELDAEARAALQ